MDLQIGLLYCGDLQNSGHFKFALTIVSEGRGRDAEIEGVDFSEVATQ